MTDECFSPRMTYSSNGSSLHSPAQFRRNQDFYISSWIEIACNPSLSIKTNWTIFTCNPTCSIEANLDRSLNMTHTELFIPARVLANGLYEITLTLMVINSSDLITPTSIFVRINPVGVVVNLVQFGILMITSETKRDLTLNPGQFSAHPDWNTFNGDVSSNHSLN